MSAEESAPVPLDTLSPSPAPGAPVRLLLVNPSPVRGGAEEMLIQFVTRCDRARVDPLVACLTDGPFVDDLESAGARVVRLRAGRLRYLWLWARTVLRLARLARRADVVLSWQVKGHYYGTPAARLARRPAAWWDHGVRPARGESKYLLGSVLPRSLRADLVVTSSSAAAARHARARAVPPGIDLARYEDGDRGAARAALGIGDAERAVGIVGRLQPSKGQHVFLRAAALVGERHPDARFVVIGGTPGGFSMDYPARLERLAADLGIADRVRFLGQRPDVPSLLPGLDVFVLSSFDESFGLVTVEAMAAGVPVVVTAVGGVPEIVEDGVCGLLVPPGDHRAMADAIGRVLDDARLRSSIVATARARARERFGVDRYVREVEDLVRVLAESRRS